MRIGLHADDAARTLASYAGRGVHVAARVGAEAAGEGILVSSTTVEGHEAVKVVESKTVELKGIAEPVELLTVAWR